MLLLIANLTNVKDILKSRTFLQKGRIKMLPTEGWELTHFSTILQEWTKLGMVANTCHSNTWRQWQEDHHKFKVSLVYIVSSRLASYTASPSNKGKQRMKEKKNNQLVSEKYSGKNYFEAIILVSTKQNVFRLLRFTIFFFTTSKRK